MKKKIIKDSVFLVVANFIIKFKGLISIPIMVRCIGLEYYGAYTQIIANISVIVPFCQFAIGQGFYRYTSTYDFSSKDKIGCDYWSALFFVMLLSALGFFGVYYCSSLISDKILGGLSFDSVRLSAFLVFTASLYSINSKFIQSRKQFVLSSVFQVIYSLAPYVAMLIGVVLKKTLFAGLFLYLLMEIVLNVMMLIYIIYQVGIYLPSLQRVTKFLKFTAPLTASSFSGSLLSKLDRYFIGYFCGPQSIGIYSIVYSLCSILDQFSVPFTKYFQIYLPKLWDEKKRNKVKLQLQNGLKFYLVISIGSVFILAFIAKPLIFWLLNKDLSRIVHFEILTIVLGMGIVALGVSRFFYHLTLYREKTHLQLYIQLVGVMVNCVLNYFLIKRFAVIGAGVATFLSYLVIVFLCLYMLDMGLNRSFALKTALILFAGVMVVAVFECNNDVSFVMIILKSIFAGTLYFVILFACKVIKFTEIKTFLHDI